MGVNRLCAGRSKFHSGSSKGLGRAADDYQGEKVFEDRHIPVRLGGKAPRGGAAATRLRRRGSQGERPGPNPEGCLEEK